MCCDVLGTTHAARQLWYSLCVRLCTHAARKLGSVFVFLKYTPLYDCSSLLEEFIA